MDNVRYLPVPKRSEIAAKEDSLQPGGPYNCIPEALVEWVAGIDALDPEQDGLGVNEIACVEAYWSYCDVGFSSAGFVVKTHDERRFYFQVAIDADTGPDIVALAVEQLPAGRRRPDPVDPRDPASNWSTEVDAFNIDLARLKASNVA